MDISEHENLGVEMSPGSFVPEIAGPAFDLGDEATLPPIMLGITRSVPVPPLPPSITWLLWPVWQATVNINLWTWPRGSENVLID